MPRSLPPSARAVTLSAPLFSAMGARLVLLGALLLCSLAPVRAELSPERAEPRAHASFLAMSVASPDIQRARLSTAMRLAGDQGQDATTLSATFGWMEDSGSVLLMSHGPCQSSSPLARTQRVVESTVPIHSLTELPRYLMICSWRLEDGVAREPTVAYAERDDANGRVRSTRDYASLSVPWVPTAARHAQAHFSGHDYCGEIARSGTTAALPWPAASRQAAR